MPDVEMTSLFGLTMENARTTLANTAAFRTWTGESSIAGAKGRIALWTDLFGNFPRPYALVSLRPGFRRRWNAEGGAAGEFHPWGEGTINIRFVAEMAPIHKDNPASAAKQFFEDADGIMQGMADIQGTAGQIAFSSITLADELQIMFEEDGNAFDGFTVEFDIEVGTTGGGA